jgi:hypothetical protein
MLCEDTNSSRIVYYSEATRGSSAHCTECEEGRTGRVIGIFFGIIATVLLIVVIVTGAFVRLPKTSTSWIPFAWKACNVKLKVILSFYVRYVDLTHRAGRSIDRA